MPSDKNPPAPKDEAEKSRLESRDPPVKTNPSGRKDSPPQPGDNLDNPTASAATGEHPEPTKKNEPTVMADTGERRSEEDTSTGQPTDLATGETQDIDTPTKSTDTRLHQNLERGKK